MVDNELKGIAGWLILPFIHMVFYIGYIIYDLLVNVPQVPQNYTLPFIVIDIILWILFATTLIIGFMKKRLAKILFIISYLSNIILAIVVGYIISDYTGLVQPLIAGIVWIWYFSVSERVKNTFVN